MLNALFFYLKSADLGHKSRIFIENFVNVTFDFSVLQLKKMEVMKCGLSIM